MVGIKARKRRGGRERGREEREKVPTQTGEQKKKRICGERKCGRESRGVCVCVCHVERYRIAHVGTQNLIYFILFLSLSQTAHFTQHVVEF